jgi:hypothetical protein
MRRGDRDEHYCQNRKNLLSFHNHFIKRGRSCDDYGRKAVVR